MDDSTLIWPWTPEDQGEAEFDQRLKTWFQRLLAEPAPSRFLDLVERLDRAGGM